MRKLSILLFVLMIVSLLAGCADELASTPPAAVPEPSAATVTPESSALPIDEIDTSSYYSRVMEEQDDALTPFVHEALAQGIDADTLFLNYLEEMALPDDSAVFQKTERSLNEGEIVLRTAILHEQPINASGLSSEASLDDLVQAQYGYYQEHGNIDYTGNADAPTYQVVGLAINGSYVKAEFTVTVNGIDAGTYTLDHNVLLLPMNTDRFPADAPVEVHLTVLSGNLPTPDYIYIGLQSNISGGR